MGGINALEARRRILLNTPHIETASGSIATFQTDMVSKLKECKIYFEPVQNGSGDPSPDNVRPITGWTGCEVTRCGRNLWNENPLNFKTTKTITDCVVRFSLNNSTASVAISAAMISWINASGGTIYYAAGSFKRTTDGARLDSLESPYTGDFYIRASRTLSSIRYRNWPNLTNVSKFGVFVDGSSEYEGYNGVTAAIDWTDEAGTVYGGYVDLVKGEVVAEWVSYLFDGTERLPDIWYNFDRQQGYNSSGVYWHLNVLKLPLQKTGANRTIISDKLARNIYGCYGRDLNYIFGISQGTTVSNTYISMRLPNDVLDISSASALQNSAMSYLVNNPVRIAYEIATPIHYLIDPITLKTLRGTNNIFANTNGNAEVKFYTH